MVIRRLAAVCLVPAYVLLLLLVLAPEAQAQRTPNCVTGCVTYSVLVTGGGTASQPASSGPHTVSFSVLNTGNVADTYSLTCSATGGISCGTVTPGSVTLWPSSGPPIRPVPAAPGAAAPGDPPSSALVTVSYNVGVSSGSVTLTATGTGPGAPSSSAMLTVTAVLSPGFPQVALRNHNRDNLDRSLCLTAGAGEAAAWSCGDLVMTHGMPGYTTMGRERSLTLIHNSATAYPRPTIAAAVTQSVAAPTTVVATVMINGTARDSAIYAGWTGGTRQVVVDFKATAAPVLATGAYPFQLKVRNQYGGSVHEAAVNDTLLVVNRSATEFGSGFGIAGLEQLFPDQPVGTSLGHILWVGGDGSAKLYRKLNATTWVAPLGAFQDMLILSGGVYTRTLRHGIQVKFSGSGLNLGRHIATVNRAGQQSTFTWNAAGNRLISIQVPPACGAGCTYTLAYDASNTLDFMVDPAGRKLDATFAAGQLTSLKDPDGRSVGFGWDGNQRIISRTGRRGFTTTYEYSLGRTVGSRITMVTEPVGRITGDNTVAVTVFEPWNERGLTGVPGQTAVDTSQAYTRVQGPRPGVPDDASFWVDRWGAPTRIVNAIGVITRVVRGDAANPALVTQVTYPNNRIGKMSYNGRGNLTGVRDSTSHLGAAGRLPFTKSTTYTYGSTATPDSPTLVADGLGRTAKYSYTGLGFTDSVIDQRGHRTKFLYDSTSTIKGVVKQIVERAVETWRQSDSSVVTMDQVYRFAYDTKGNAKVDTAANKTVTSYVRDSAGRVKDVYDALGTHRAFTYDSLNRLKTAAQDPTAQSNPYGLTLGSNCEPTQVVCTDQTQPANPVLSTLTNQYRYGPLDLDTIIDPRAARRAFARDARRLVWKETDDLGAARTTSYGVGGTADTSTSRGGVKVIYQYDELGRRTQVTYPRRVYDGPCPGGTSLCASSDTVPGETITYGYDSLNNVLSSIGAVGTITRKYYEDGSLRMKITSIPGLVPDTLIYSYDASGARTRLIHARDMRDTTDYIYNTGTGDLDSMVVRYGPPLNQKYTFGFSWDGLGRRKQVLYPIKSGTKRMSVTLSHDAAGTLRRLRSAHPDSSLGVSIRLNFTFRNERVDAIGRILRQVTTCHMQNNADLTGSPCSGTAGPDSTTSSYNRFSMLVKQTHSFGSTIAVDSMGYDASGNLSFRRDGTANVFHSFTMKPNSNQLQTDVRAGHTWTFFYNEDGSRLHEGSSTLFYDDRDYRYDGLERMSGSMKWDPLAQPAPIRVSNPTSCRYDPEGQMTQPCDNGAPKLAYEGNNVSAAGNVGLNWSFVHGPALDDPLMGLARWATGNKKVFFWVTDGQGRHLAFADSTGRLISGDYELRYGQNGGKYAGGTSSASSFQADRFSTPTIPGVSFFRNRAYDRETGRWTQEDPIGVAGGLNLYQFNGNNPVAYTDPFGLCPTCGPALIAAGAVGGIRLIGNLIAGRSAFENVGRDAIIAGAVVLTLGAALPGAAAATAGLATAESGASFSASSLAGEVAGATGGVVSALSKSEGFKVTMSAGGRDVVARIKESGEFRVAIEGLGALTRSGAISSDRAQTHLKGATAEEVSRLMKQAADLVQAGRP